MVDRIPHDAPVLVIGLGRFGAATAGQLARLDREVLAIDGDINLVQKWSDRLTHTVQADARSIDALKQVGAQDFAIGVCAVGADDRCEGCFRTLDEIARWGSMPDVERLRIMKEVLPEREAGTR